MASQMSTYLQNAVINATLRNTAYTSPTTVYVGLFTTTVTAGGSGTEVTGGQTQIGRSRISQVFRTGQIDWVSVTVEINDGNCASTVDCGEFKCVCACLAECDNVGSITL